jgi:hypothetical protein
MDSRIVGFISDLGLKDDAVGIVKGLMLSICPDLRIIDICHNCEPFNVREAALYLGSSSEYFPEGSIFICIVYPETGTKTPVIAVKNNKNQIFVAPNNGSLTYVVENTGVNEVHEVSSNDVMHPNISFSHTFYGLHKIAYCAAQLARGFPLEKVGKRLPIKKIIKLPLNKPYINRKGEIMGEIMVADKNYGNLWTNIPMSLVFKQGIRYGDTLEVGMEEYVSLKIPFKKTFGEVLLGKPVAYINSRGFLAIALNRGNLLKKFNFQNVTSIKVKKFTGDELYDRANILKRCLSY